MKPVLVRDLALERWVSMNRYADSLAPRIPDAVVPEVWQMPGPRYLTRYWSYPRALRRWRGDLVHVLDHSYAHCLRAFRGVPSVVTVHDLHPLRTLAEDTRGVRGLVRDELLRWVLRWLRRADRFIVISAFTAQELGRYLEVEESRVTVVHLGVDAHFANRPVAEVIRERRDYWRTILGLGTPPAAVLLHVGNCHPRKNVEAAIGALGLLRRRGVDAILVQIGGRFGETHRRAAAGAGVADRIVQEHDVSEEDLVSAYHAADVLVMPSSYEGFGLPVLEAMAAGLPVVTSGASALREVAGDAAIVTGSTAAEPLADAVATLLAEEPRRMALIAQGRARAAGRTWDHVARETTAVYDQLLGR